MSLLPDTFIVMDTNSRQIVVIPRESIVTIHFPVDPDGKREGVAHITLSSTTRPEIGNDVVRVEGAKIVDDLFNAYLSDGGRMFYGKRYEPTEPKVEA